MRQSTALILPLAAFTILLVGSAAQAQESRRVLAPGVLTVIDTRPEAKETFIGPRPLAKIAANASLDFDPELNEKTATIYDKAQGVTERFKIWTLEFAFKPLRMIYVDVPEAPGILKRKLIWYMVYRVRNVGNHLQPEPNTDGDGFIAQKTVTTPSGIPGTPDGRAFFFPHFVLEGEFYDPQTKSYDRRAYLDRIIPEVRVPIQQREDPLIPLYNSVEMMRRPLAQPASPDEISEANTAWGVVTWQDVNPNVDFAAVYIQGLTNAFEISEAPGEPPVFRHKTLQLNFWRPGDQYLEHEKEFRYGVPLVPDEREQLEILSHYGLTERLDYLWIYR